uniref:Uncharacterized protein n=1 Tax=Lygus hesperus TaxID=30085 RepID=A0A0K8S515_LYGHE
MRLSVVVEEAHNYSQHSSSLVLKVSSEFCSAFQRLFPKMKEKLVGNRFSADEEVQEEVTKWIREQAARFYKDWISKLFARYSKCIETAGDCVPTDFHREDHRECLRKR